MKKNGQFLKLSYFFKKNNDIMWQISDEKGWSSAPTVFRQSSSYILRPFEKISNEADCIAQPASIYQ